MLSFHDKDKVVRAVEECRDEMVGFLQQLVRIDEKLDRVIERENP